MSGFDLESIIANIKPNVVTPHLADVTAVKNPKKPHVIADLIVRNIHASLTNPVTKDVIHDGEIHKIRYFDIEPLMTGVWAEVSLMLLHLSYGEQVSVIEAIYPKQIQLTAKAFAINFTPDIKTTDIKIENDTELVDKLDSANAGIATIIAMLRKGTNNGSSQSSQIHPDNIKAELANVQSLVTTQREIESYRNATKRAEAADHNRDLSL